MKDIVAMMGPTAERFKEENPNPTWELAYEKYKNGEDPDGAVAWMLCENVGYFIQTARRFGMGHDLDSSMEVSIDGVMRALTTYDPDHGTAFHTWVYTCLRTEWWCRRRVGTTASRLPNQTVLSLDFEMEYGDNGNYDAYNLVGEIPREIELIELADIVDRVKLSDRQRFILEETVFKENTNVAVAEMLGTTSQNVSELKSRALSRIRYYIDTEVK